CQDHHRRVLHRGPRLKHVDGESHAIANWHVHVVAHEHRVLDDRRVLRRERGGADGQEDENGRYASCGGCAKFGLTSVSTSGSGKQVVVPKGCPLASAPLSKGIPRRSMSLIRCPVRNSSRRRSS